MEKHDETQNIYRKTASELAALLFLAREIAHRVHLHTDSYAKHKALDEFYNEIIDLADRFVEAYQGKYEILTIPILPYDSVYDIPIIDTLEAQLVTIDSGRVFLPAYSPLQNIVDEICGLYMSTLYKLKYLH